MVERWGGGWNEEDTVRVTCAMCETFYSTTLRTVCTIFTFSFIHWIYLVFYLKRLHRNKRVSQKVLLEYARSWKEWRVGPKSVARWMVDVFFAPV